MQRKKEKGVRDLSFDKLKKDCRILSGSEYSKGIQKSKSPDFMVIEKTKPTSRKEK
jgi:hypothetical protein